MSLIETLYDAVETVIDYSKKRKSQETAPNFHSDSKLSYAYECYKAEHERRRRIETKSASLVTTIGVVATLITAGVIRLFLKNYEYGTLEYTLMIALFLMSLFLGLSCYYAVIALRPQQYKYIEISDFKNFNDESYYEEFIRILNDCIEYNIPLGQKKSKDMDKAQKWFRAAVLVLMIYSSTLSIIYVFDKMSGFVNNLSEKYVSVGSDTIVTWTMIIMLIGILLSVVLSIIAIIRINNLSKKFFGATPPEDEKDKPK